MTFADFRKKYHISRQDICRRTFEENRDNIRIKKEATAVKNMDAIYAAALEIANKKGFQAMTMRDLSRETQMSMGGLYAYFAGKEDLLRTIQHQHREYFSKILTERVKAENHPAARLRAAIRTHLYVSEVMQPWFYFSFMETKNLPQPEKEKAIASELATEKMICDILAEGQSQGVFKPHDPRLGASVIKGMLQDWYLKRGKYAKRNVSVDQYAAYLIEFVESFFVPNPL